MMTEAKRTPGTVDFGNMMLWPNSNKDNGWLFMPERVGDRDEAIAVGRYFKASWNACDAIGASTEALEAGVLGDMRVILNHVACNRGALQDEARALLAKLEP